jgi:hypothetical protein
LLVAAADAATTEAPPRPNGAGGERRGLRRKLSDHRFCRAPFVTTHALSHREVEPIVSNFMAHLAASRSSSDQGMGEFALLSAASVSGMYEFESAHLSQSPSRFWPVGSLSRRSLKARNSGAFLRDCPAINPNGEPAGQVVGTIRFIDRVLAERNLGYFYLEVCRIRTPAVSARMSGTLFRF